MQLRSGRHEVRAGRARFTTSEIILLLPPASNERAVLEGAMHGKAINPISLPKWLKDRLVDAPTDGHVLRSGNDRKKLARFGSRPVDDAHESSLAARCGRGAQTRCRRCRRCHPALLRK
jgi:hypothetical protein